MRLPALLELNAAKKPPFAGIINSVNTRLSEALDKFDAGHISKKTFLKRSKAILGSGYKKAYLHGAGLAKLDADGNDFVDQFSDKQFSYLDSFADDIEAGSGKMDYYDRLGMYAKAVQSAYWAGAAADAPEGTMINWVTTANESCEDCLDFESNGPYLPGEVPAVPGDGTTRCRSNCKCYLVKVNQ